LRLKYFSTLHSALCSIEWVECIVFAIFRTVSSSWLMCWWRVVFIYRYFTLLWQQLTLRSVMRVLKTGCLDL